MYVTISKRFKIVDKQEKYNSSAQLFLEVYYYQRVIITRNVYGNKIITFLKLNEFDQFYNKKLVAQGRSGEIGAPNRKCEFKKKVYD